MWYNYDKLFSRQALINFVMGGRGIGKSFGAKLRSVKLHLKSREESKNGQYNQTMYIRRTKEELKKVKPTYFNDLIEHFPDHEFCIDGDFGYIDGEIAVIFIALTESGNLKSVSYPNVVFGIFDEYVITKNGYNRYLENEMTLLLDIIESIVRLRTDFKLVILSNNVSYINPFFLFYKIEPVPGDKFIIKQKGKVLVEIAETSNTYKEKKLKTDFGQLIAGTSYGDYLFGDDTLEDSNEFIMKKPEGKYYPLIIIKSNLNEIALWLHEEYGIIYVDKKLKGDVTRAVLRTDEVTDKYIHISLLRKNWKLKKIKAAYLKGNMYFFNQECKKFFIDEVIKYI